MSPASPVSEKYVVCASCDAGCILKAEVREGRVVRVKTTDIPPLRQNICIKGVYAPRNFSHPSRLLYPQRRAGERGSGKWERVSWDAALDDIAERLRRVIDRYGPEGFAVANSSWNTSVENGCCRRFMNFLGSPNWISGIAMCAGNTAAINRMVYGWFPFPDFFQTNCVVLFGHNPKRPSWTPFYKLAGAAAPVGRLRLAAVRAGVGAGDGPARRVPRHLRFLAPAGGAPGAGRPLPLADRRGGDRPPPGALGPDVRRVRRQHAVLHAAAGVPQVREGRLRHAVGQGRAVVERPGGARLRPAALLPRGAPARRGVPADTVRRGARRRVLPQRPAPRRGAAAAEAAAEDVPAPGRRARWAWRKARGPRPRRARGG